MKSVLLVDDNKSFLDALSYSLKKKDIKVSVAYSVDEALKKINKENFDLICSDYDMGEKSGLDLFNIILKNNYKTKFFMITGSEDEKLQDEVESRGGRFFDKSNLEFINIIKDEICR